MQRRQLGTGKLQISVISLGAMSFGSGFSRETLIDEVLAAQLVNRALDAGVNLIDTADTYGGAFGRSESVLGKVVKNRRGEAPACHEGGLRGPRAERSHLRQGHCRLRGKPAPARRRPPRPVPAAPSRSDRPARGNPGSHGKSRHPRPGPRDRHEQLPRLRGSARARQRASGQSPISGVQVQYSLVARDIEHEIVPQCRADQVGILAYQPLASGQLTGWQETAGARGRRRLGILGEETQRLQRAREVVDAIAKGRGVSMAQVALAWVLAQPGVTSAIVGPSKLAQWEDNLRAAELVLDDSELRDLAAVTALQPLYPASMDRSMGFPEPGETFSG